MSSENKLESLRRIVVSYGSPDSSAVDEERLTDEVKATLPFLEELRDQFDTGDESYIEAVRLLADAARQEEWRDPLRSSGLLKSIIETWNIDDSPALSKQILRFWGNSCIDNDASREVAANAGLGLLASALRNPSSVSWDASLCAMGVNTLYNTCLEYEPAQQKAARLSLPSALIELLVSYEWSSGDSIFELSAMLIAKATEIDHTMFYKAKYLDHLERGFDSHEDVVDSGYILDALMSYTKAALVTASSAKLALVPDAVLRKLELYKLRQEALSVSDEEEVEFADEHLRSVMTALVEAYDKTPRPDLTSESETILISWIRERKPHLAECACLILGNRDFDNPQTAVRHVQQDDLPVPLLELVVTGPDMSSKHAAAGFLTALCLPPENKLALTRTDEDGTGTVWKAVHSLLFAKDFGLIKDSFVLLGAFLKDSLQACHFILELDRSEADMTLGLTRLRLLTDRCSKMHGDSPFTAAPLVAFARLVTTITRVMLQPAMTSVDASVERLLQTPDLLHPLMETLKHTEEKGLRLDCTVGLARIACSTTEGAMLLARTMNLEESSLLDTIENICRSEEKEPKANCQIVVESVLRLALVECTSQVRERLVSLRRLLSHGTR